MHTGCATHITKPESVGHGCRVCLGAPSDGLSRSRLPTPVAVGPAQRGAIRHHGLISFLVSGFTSTISYSSPCRSSRALILLQNGQICATASR
eukprot:scaffold2315_cov145-Isochrysis_galbana.AAC.14